MTVLVLEDDASVLAVVERLLKAEGHTVMAARDPAGADAVLTASAAVPDVLLTDIILSGETGVEYATLLKGRYPAVKIVFMTGLAHRAPTALRSGLGPVLHKPFSAVELYRAINELA